MSLADTILGILESANAEGIEETSEGYKCCCPLPEHNDSTPSFAIECDEGLWRCYGCKAKGNLNQLCSRLFGLTAKQAEKQFGELLNRNKEWPSMPPDPIEHRRKREELIILPEAVLLPYSGLCPRYMVDTRGFPKKFLREMGIGYDADVSRVVFPIRTVKGELVGLTRRATLPGDHPKYKHTRFSKGSHWYLGEWLPKVDYDKEAVIVVEGHIDALQLMYLTRGKGFGKSRVSHQLASLGAPIGAAVAQMGSSMTDDQARLIRRYTKKVILAYDHDDAGDKAEERALEALLGQGFRDIYTLDYDRSDPGEIKPYDTVGLSRY